MIQRPVTRGAFKEARRFRQIVNVLIKYGFGEAIARIRVWESVHFEKRIFIYIDFPAGRRAVKFNSSRVAICRVDIRIKNFGYYFKALAVSQ